MIHDDTPGRGNVDHIQCDDEGNPQFLELHGQIEIPVQVGGIHNVHNQVRPFVDQIIPGDDLLQGIGSEGIGAREINDFNLITLVMDLPEFLFHCDAGVIGNVLSGPCDGIENSRLPRIGISGKGYGNLLHAFSCCSSSTSTRMLSASWFRSVRI